MGLGFVVPWVLDGARGSGAGTPQLLGGQGANYAHQITISPIRILDLPPVLNHAGRAISELTFFSTLITYLQIVWQHHFKTT